MAISRLEASVIKRLISELENDDLKALLSRYNAGNVDPEELAFLVRCLLSSLPPAEIALKQLRKFTNDRDLKVFLNRYQQAEISASALREFIISLPQSAGESSDSSAIVLNSFPKSGNTWLRYFLAYLCFDGSPQSIPDHYSGNIFDAPSYTLPDGRSVRFYKSHNQRLLESFRNKSVVHAAAIHIRRHPLDVFLSYLNHLHLNHGDLLTATQPSQQRTGRAFLATKFKNVAEIVEQDMIWAFLGSFIVFGTLNPAFISTGSWHSHTRYWMCELPEDLPIFRYTYESLSKNKANDLCELGKFLGKSGEEVEKAFDATQRATAVDGSFFWKQKPGLYKDTLSARDLERYKEQCGEETQKFGYNI